VAIKVAKVRDDLLTEELSSFLGEARRVAQLKHPSIVSVLDVSRGDAETGSLVMEYVDGPTLTEVFAEGQMSMTALVGMLIEIADGVHHAHTHGILHRDLKPGNILLGRDDRPRIVDFGMALHEREQYSAPRKAAGTPYCMAPEQVRGETHRLDPRTDVWSLGVILYEGLTGQRPFYGSTFVSTFDAILKDDPCPLSFLNSSIPAELARICGKCLSKRMGDRYGSAAELSADLKRWLDDPHDDRASCEKPGDNSRQRVAARGRPGRSRRAQRAAFVRCRGRGFLSRLAARASYARRVTGIGACLDQDHRESRRPGRSSRFTPLRTNWIW
jgi:serine/threonine protein kinase